MRLLHQEGLNGNTFSFDGIEAKLLSLTNASFNNFFLEYIYGAGDFAALFGDSPNFKARNPGIKFSSLGDQ